MMKRSTTALTIALATGLSPLATAATGIYLTGYGTQEQGMGGATIAVGQSAMAAATNPAGMAFVGNRWDIGFGTILPNSTTEANGTSYKIKRSVAPFMEFGYNQNVNEAMSAGVSVWSSGGGTKYGAPFGGIPGNSATESQGVFLHVAPTISYKFNNHHALALSLVGSVSTFRLDGIESQSGQSNRGRQWEPGYGFKLGWLSEFTPYFSVGAFYASKVKNKKFDKYDHILPDGGSLDEPEHWGIGVALKPTSSLLFALDYLRYNYGDTKGFGNRLNFSVPFGSENASGFGLRNVNVFRGGAAYNLNEKWTIRGGVEFSKSPITSDNTAFTFLLPVTPDRTYTLGATYNMDKATDISMAYAYSPNKRIEGTGLSTGVNPRTKLNYFAISFSKKF